MPAPKYRRLVNKNHTWHRDRLRFEFLTELNRHAPWVLSDLRDEYAVAPSDQTVAIWATRYAMDRAWVRGWAEYVARSRMITRPDILRNWLVNSKFDTDGVVWEPCFSMKIYGDTSDPNDRPTRAAPFLEDLNAYLRRARRHYIERHNQLRAAGYVQAPMRPAADLHAAWFVQFKFDGWTLEKIANANVKDNAKSVQIAIKNFAAMIDLPRTRPHT